MKPKSDTESKFSLDDALRKANIKPSEERFSNDIVYDSIEKILTNFEDFINTYFPKYSLKKINDLLKKYNINTTIQDFMKNNTNNDIVKQGMGGLSNMYFDLIYTIEDKEYFGNLALIGNILLYNLYISDPTLNKDYADYIKYNINLSYNTNHKAINELRLYFNTNLNAGKETKLKNIYSIIIDMDCYNNNLCYSTIKKMIEDKVNADEVINTYYDDIENASYLSFLTYIDIGDEISKKQISDDYYAKRRYLNEKGYQNPK